MKKNKFLTIILISVFLSSCTQQRAPLGTSENPIKMYFVPSVDVKVIETNAEAIKNYLEANTPYKYQISIPQSYVAVVEAFGTKRADISAMNTFGYIMAREKYGVEARLTVLRHGEPTYRSQFIVRTNSNINKLSDLEGKKIAFVDPASTSGYLLPLKKLKDGKITVKESVFAMKHDSVVSMVYQGQVDAGATFYSPPGKNGIEDARRMVKTQYPDVEEKVKILDLSDAIPNDPIVFREGMPEEMKQKVIQAFLDFMKTKEGKIAFNQIYGVTELKKATDADYDQVREMLKSLGKSATELIK